MLIHPCSSAAVQGPSPSHSVQALHVLHACANSCEDDLLASMIASVDQGAGSKPSLLDVLVDLCEFTSMQLCTCVPCNLLQGWRGAGFRSSPPPSPLHSPLPLPPLPHLAPAAP